jgi:hypothetical protein
MKFHKCTIADRNEKTYEVLINFDNSGRSDETAKFLSAVACDPLGGGLHSLAPVGTPCLVMEDVSNDFWILGYYNVTHPGSVNGWILDDKYPRPKIGDNDAILRHTSGNYLLQTDGELRMLAGISAQMSLIGRTENAFNLVALRININNSAGYFSWHILKNEADIDTPSSFEWKIQKNFEQFDTLTPSDYTLIRSGTIKENEKAETDTCVFDINTVQYVEGSDVESATTYLSLSRDDDDNLLKLEINDVDNAGSTSYIINKGYYHNWTISDGSRNVIMDIMHDDGSTNLKLDLNGSVTVTAKDDGNLEFKTDTKAYFISPLVHLGSETAAEPLACGTSLMAKLNELIDDYKLHKHPTPAGPSGPPLPPTANFPIHVEDDYLSKISFTDKEQEE